jgi:hypothetical protein
MLELLTVIGALAVILIGIAVVLRVISFDEALSSVGRAVLAFAVLLVMLGILKALWFGLMIPWFLSAVECLKRLLKWLLVIAIGLITVSFVVRIVLRRFGRYLTLRRDPQTGDGYDLNDSEDARN